MRRFLIFLALVGSAVCNSFPLLAAQNDFEDYLPIRAGMKLTFTTIQEHIEQKNQPWHLVVNKESYPESIAYTWTRSQKNKPFTGSRVISDLKSSHDFNPWFKNNELKSTSDTAPWISFQILKELQEKGTADDFREGGSGAVNCATIDLAVKEKVIFPVCVNGKSEALHAYQINKGIIIWNNRKNPLVLQYEPLGIPVLNGVTGWKLVAIHY